MEIEICHFEDIKTLSEAAADMIALRIIEGVRLRGIFSIALSGGNTPKLLYEILSSPPYKDDIPWNKTHLFFGDERYVPFNHPESNYRMAFESLISKVDIPERNVYRIPTDINPAESAAYAYEHTLKLFFKQAGINFPGDPRFPAFDLVLLGMGADGHVASLFPGSSVLYEKIKSVAAVTDVKAKPTIDRITLTLPAINNAEFVLFMAAGQEKKSVIKKIIDNPKAVADIYPAAMVRPREKLAWFYSA